MTKNVEYSWRPTFSRLQVKVIDNEFAKIKSKTTDLIIVQDDSSRLPYIEVEVLEVGPNAGWDSEHNVHYQNFSKGDVLRVFEKHVEFHYLDGKAHNEYFDETRPYVAFIQDKYTIAKRYEANAPEEEAYNLGYETRITKGAKVPKAPVGVR